MSEFSGQMEWVQASLLRLQLKLLRRVKSVHPDRRGVRIIDWDFLGEVQGRHVFSVLHAADGDNTPATRDAVLLGKEDMEQILSAEQT